MPGPQQFVVKDVEQVIDDEPYRLFRGHPMQVVETGEVYRAGKRPQRPLPPQIEIKIEIADGQLAQVAVTGSR